MSLSEPVLDYVFDAKPLHRDLRRALVQLSGFMLARLTGRRNAIVDYAPVEAAGTAIRDCTAALARLRTPASAAHHRVHLGEAVDALQRACSAALSKNDPDGNDLFRALEEAEKHLRALGRILPGFEAVDFTQACCASHDRLSGRPAQECR